MRPAHLDEGQDGVDDRLLVLEASLLAQDVAQEVHQAAVLGGELEAQRTDSLNHDHLEVICRAASCMANAGCIAYTVQDQDVFAVHMNERA